MRRRKDRIDENQPEIVEDLRKAGYSVEVGHDDILVGYRGFTFWYEIKDPEKTLTKSGQFKKGAIKEDQERILNSFTGHYKIVFSAQEIIDDIDEITRRVIPF